MANWQIECIIAFSFPIHNLYEWLLLLLPPVACDSVTKAEHYLCANQFDIIRLML
jgi:hypothetical protein